jgi:hypothetical protein
MADARMPEEFYELARPMLPSENWFMSAWYFISWRCHSSRRLSSGTPGVFPGRRPSLSGFNRAGTERQAKATSLWHLSRQARPSRSSPFWRRRLVRGSPSPGSREL